MKLKQINTYLQNNKASIGFGEYTLEVSLDDKIGTNIAETYISELEQEIQVKLAPCFFMRSDKLQRSVLNHELIHARLCVMQQRIEEVKGKEEELFCNSVESFVRKIQDR